jgi:hypothetical protein
MRFMRCAECAAQEGRRERSVSLTTARTGTVGGGKRGVRNAGGEAGVAVHPRAWKSAYHAPDAVDHGGGPDREGV